MDNIQLENKDIVPPTENKDFTPLTSRKKKILFATMFVVAYIFLSITILYAFLELNSPVFGFFASLITLILCAYAIHFFTKQEWRLLSFIAFIGAYVPFLCISGIFTVFLSDLIKDLFFGGSAIEFSSVRFPFVLLSFFGFTFIFWAYAIYFFTKKELRWKRKMLSQIIVIPLIISSTILYIFFRFVLFNDASVTFHMPSKFSTEGEACLGIKIKTITPEREKEIEKELKELEKSIKEKRNELDEVDNNYKKTKNIQDKIRRDSLSSILEEKGTKRLRLEEEKSIIWCYGYRVTFRQY